jgi:hypothetical protein
MLEEERTMLVETRNDLDADLIADLIEYLMKSDFDESLTGDGRILCQGNSSDFS